MLSQGVGWCHLHQTGVSSSGCIQGVGCAFIVHDYYNAHAGMSFNGMQSFLHVPWALVDCIFNRVAPGCFMADMNIGTLPPIPSISLRSASPVPQVDFFVYRSLSVVQNLCLSIDRLYTETSREGDGSNQSYQWLKCCCSLQPCWVVVLLIRLCAVPY